ncbi:MAG: PAS domain-containing protein [Clostridia bacterium]
MDNDILDALCRTAEALATTFGRNCETVVHDFSSADCRIAAIYNGHVSGRTVDSAATIYGGFISSYDCKELVPTNDYVNTMVVMHDGRRIKSTSINYIGKDYHYVLGVNFDTTTMFAAANVLRDIMKTDKDFDAAPLTDQKLNDALDYCLSMLGKAPDKLTKAERIQIVSMLNNNDIFSIQKAVPYVSERLGVSRYTIYNYLNEIRHD